MNTDELISLHGHFLAADSVKQFLFVDVPVDEATAAEWGKYLDVAQFWSQTMRLQVFYALLYVVVEGYRDFGCQDDSVDELLAQSDRVEDSGDSGMESFILNSSPYRRSEGPSWKLKAVSSGPSTYTWR